LRIITSSQDNSTNFNSSNQTQKSNQDKMSMVSAFPIVNNLGLYAAQQQASYRRQDLMVDNEFCMDKKFSVSSTSSTASFADSMSGMDSGLKRTNRAWRNLADCLQS